jgi:hypothetical protein
LPEGDDPDRRGHLVTILEPRLFPVEQHATTSDDYYTPAWVFERMGIDFDLDVCSPSGGIPWIPARRFFTMADDGLAQPWEGRVWMNPPYSNCTPWVRRFVDHGHGIALLPLAKSGWFTRLWGTSVPMVVIDSGFFDFVGGPVFCPTFFAAFGEDCVEAISRLGRVRR